ncbi:MAG: ferrochelatase, partial [Alphaproteobacteria bacterium]|nr:ferrochelatase [Alphaproteobacteria bacterium]
MKKGVLIVNLGTPDDPSVLSVQRYLRQFLRDPRVIDLPTFIRYVLVYGVIVPIRSFKSAHAYQSIWGEVDSPLRVITQQTQRALAEKLGDGYQVAYAMRYGKPAIADVVQTLRTCQELIVIPLFPQYSSAATGSAMACVFEALSKLWNIPKVHVLNAFYDHPGYIRAVANVITKHLPQDNFLLFSYHGLPQRHIAKSECTQQCGQNPCPVMAQGVDYCYRRQCYVT